MADGKEMSVQEATQKIVEAISSMRSGLTNLNSAISGNSGYKAGPKAV